ncbi:MAG: glycosyltransferase family 4 protein [Acidimicrobiales bacterium]
MRILVVCHYFPPEIGAPQARISELARYWADEGQDVTVLTGMPNHPTGVVPPAYRRRARVREHTDGYDVVRTWIYATPNEGMARKTLGHLSFMVTCALLGWRAAGPADVVVVSSPTFFSIFSAWLLSRTKRAALVVEVRDLWPAIFVELGVLTNRWLIKILEAAELAAYRAADKVVVVSEGFREDLIRRGVPGSKVHTVRNGVDLGRFSPDEPAPSGARARLGASEGDTLVIYIGAHGISHGLETVVEAAAKLQGQAVHLALVGEGAAKAKVQARAAEMGVTNVTFLPGVPRDEVAGLLAAADICLVPLRDVPLFSTFIPSKLFEYLAAGKAVIGSLRGEAAAILTEAGAVVVDPDDPGALAGAIASLAADPARRAEMGRAGRAYVVEHFDRRRLAAGYLELLRDAVATHAGRIKADVRKVSTQR